MKLNKKQRKLQEVIDSKAKAQMGSFVIDETGTLLKYNGSYADVYIPSSVKRIGENAFKECATIKTVWLSFSVTTLCKYAFSNCTALKSVYVTDGLEYIGNGAFMSCYSLGYFSIGKNVCHIGDGAFAYCQSLLIGIKKGSKHFKEKDLVIYTKDGKTLVAYPPGSKVSEIKVPKKVTRIRSNAFGGCLHFTTVTLPAGLCELEDFMFASCVKLRTVNIPSKVSRIGYAAFAYCKGLSEITLPSTVQSIDKNAFLIDKTVKITYEGSKENWDKVYKAKDFAVEGKYVLNCKKKLGSMMTSMNLKASEKGIKKYREEDEKFALLTDKYCHFWFDGAGKLLKYTGNSTKLYIPEGVTSVEKGAIPEEVAGKLVELHIPSTMKTVNLSLNVSNLPELEKLTIAKGVEVLSSLPSMPKLKELELPETVKQIDFMVFYNSKIEKVYIPSKLTNISPTAFLNTDVKEIKVAKKNSAYKLIGNAVIHPESKTLFMGTSKSVIPMDGSIEVIGHSAFCKRSGIKDILLPAGVKKLDVSCFSETGLESINIPDSVEVIEYLALAYTKIKELHIPKSVKTIEVNAFAGCNDLKTITVDPANETYAGVNNCIIEKATKTLLFCASGATIPNDEALVTAMGSCSVDVLDGDTVNIPACITEIPEDAIRADAKCINVDEANPNYASVDGVLYNKDKTKIIYIPKGLSGKVSIPEGMETLASYSFKGRDISEIVLPASLKVVENYVFEDCASLEKVTIAEGVTKLCSAVFRGSAIKEITLPKSLVEVGPFIFERCNNLTDIYCKSTEKPDNWSASWNNRCNAAVHWATEE